MNTQYQTEIETGAVDPGFGGIKTARVIQRDDGNLGMATYTLPSVVGVGTTNTGVLGLSGIIRQRPQARPIKVSYDGLDYLVGEGLGRYAAPSEHMDFDRFTDSPELRALLYASLSSLFKSRDIALIIGMPVEILKDKSLASETECGMRAWLVGEHRFELEWLDGRKANSLTREFNVVNIRLKEQPLGTWLDWGMDYTGEWTKGLDVARAPALIIDPGFNTVDVYAIEGGEIDRRTDGDMLGTRRIAELVIDRLDQLYGLEMSLHEADELVQIVNNGKRAFTPISGEDVEVTLIIRQALYTWVADIKRYLDRKVGKAAKFRVFITAGGSYILARRLANRFSKMVVPVNPVSSNAEGLAKLAVRSGYLL